MTPKVELWNNYCSRAWQQGPWFIRKDNDGVYTACAFVDDLQAAGMMEGDNVQCPNSVVPFSSFKPHWLKTDYVYEKEGNRIWIYFGSKPRNLYTTDARVLLGIDAPTPTDAPVERPTVDHGALFSNMIGQRSVKEQIIERDNKRLHVDVACTCGHAWSAHNEFGCCWDDDCDCTQPRR